MYAQRDLGYLREWVACDFGDVEETFEIAVLPQIPKIISQGISAEQEAAATEAVAGFVKAFSSGLYGNFKAFRMPAKYSLSQSNLATLSKLLLKGIPTNTMTFAPLSPPEWTVLGNRRGIPSTVIKPSFQKHEVRPENIVATIHR